MACKKIRLTKKLIFSKKLLQIIFERFLYSTSSSLILQLARFKFKIYLFLCVREKEITKFIRVLIKKHIIHGYKWMNNFIIQQN